VTPPPDPWEDDITQITIDDMTVQCDWMRAQISQVPQDALTRGAMIRMLEAVDELLALYLRA